MVLVYLSSGLKKMPRNLQVHVVLKLLILLYELQERWKGLKRSITDLIWDDQIIYYTTDTIDSYSDNDILIF